MKSIKIIATAIILASSTSVSADWDMPFLGNNSNNGFGDVMNDMTGNMNMDMEMRFKMKAKGNGRGNSNANNYWNSTNATNNDYYGYNGYTPYRYQQQYSNTPTQAVTTTTQ